MNNSNIIKNKIFIGYDMELVDMAIYTLFFDFVKSINKTTYDLSPLATAKTYSKAYLYVSSVNL